MSNENFQYNTETPYINYRTLPLVKAKVKFFNSADDKNFGFVTVMNEDTGKPLFDAFLSGTVLEKAGIYQLEPGDILYIRHISKPKGEAVVHVQKNPPQPLATEEAA